LTYSITTQESIAINADATPKIIISASGMCDAGRIRHHLKYNLWQEINSIVFVGYQAPGSLGRLLVEGESMIKLFGEQVIVKAQIHTIDAYSGHADLNGLLNVISTMQIKPKKIVLVHGEEDAIVNFSNEIKERFSIPTIIPSYGDIIDVALDREIMGQLDVEPLPVKIKLPDVDAAQPIEKNRKIIGSIQQIAFLASQLKKEISTSASDRITDYVNIINNILKDEIKNKNKKS
jgi:metallo-beta-lactamase family protein